ANRALVAQHQPAAVGTEVRSSEESRFQNSLAAPPVPDEKGGLLLVIDGSQKLPVWAESQVISMRTQTGQTHDFLVARDLADAKVTARIAADIVLQAGVKSQWWIALQGFGQAQVGQGQP